jgi:hypothetical protein
MSNDRLITEELIKAVQKDLYRLTISEALRRLETFEPDLCYAIIRWADDALKHLDADAEYTVDTVARANIHEAVQWSCLVAVDAVHRAYRQLWKDTTLEPLLARLNAHLGRAADDQQA